MFLADFDQTISKYYYPESLARDRALRLGTSFSGQENADASMKVMLECPKFIPEQKLETKRAFHKYYPIECDPNVPFLEK